MRERHKSSRLDEARQAALAGEGDQDVQNGGTRRDTVIYGPLRSR